jgi:very-short-patch-repair endonuclease
MMLVVLYNKSLIKRARSMRKVMTPAERHLWLHCLRDAPFKFRRQRPFGKFIVDFYCAELQLVVEVDGDSHYSDEALAYDRERTLYLESLGLRVLRFTNTEVLYRLDDVKDAIASTISPKLAFSHPIQKVLGMDIL